MDYRLYSPVIAAVMFGRFDLPTSGFHHTPTKSKLYLLATAEDTD
jgi:hypothetical protein